MPPIPPTSSPVDRNLTQRIGFRYPTTPTLPAGGAFLAPPSTLTPYNRSGNIEISSEISEIIKNTCQQSVKPTVPCEWIKRLEVSGTLTEPQQKALADVLEVFEKGKKPDNLQITKGNSGELLGLRFELKKPGQDLLHADFQFKDDKVDSICCASDKNSTSVEVLNVKGGADFTSASTSQRAMSGTGNFLARIGPMTHEQQSSGNFGTQVLDCLKQVPGIAAELAKGGGASLVAFGLPKVGAQLASNVPLKVILPVLSGPLRQIMLAAVFGIPAAKAEGKVQEAIKFITRRLSFEFIALMTLILVRKSNSNEENTHTHTNTNVILGLTATVVGAMMAKGAALAGNAGLRYYNEQKTNHDGSVELAEWEGSHALLMDHNDFSWLNLQHSTSDLSRAATGNSTVPLLLTSGVNVNEMTESSSLPSESAFDKIKDRVIEHLSNPDTWKKASFEGIFLAAGLGLGALDPHQAERPALAVALGILAWAGAEPASNLATVDNVKKLMSWFSTQQNLLPAPS
jgi:hypothetical protein